jgi:hypothetical protein
MTHKIIQEFEDRVRNECTSVDIDERYDDMLNELYSFKSVGGPFSHMQPSQVLKECDPTAYRCGKVDWEDSEDLVEIGDEYYYRSDVDRVKEEMIDELDGEIDDLDELVNDDTEDGCDELVEAHKANQADAIEARQALNKHTY